MTFTDAEKRQWHSDRQRGYHASERREKLSSPTCGHCGNPFSEGVVTPDFALCDVCNGD